MARILHGHLSGEVPPHGHLSGEIPVQEVFAAPGDRRARTGMVPCRSSTGQYIVMEGTSESAQTTQVVGSNDIVLKS